MLGMSGQQVFCLLITVVVGLVIVAVVWAPPSRRKNQIEEDE